MDKKVSINIATDIILENQLEVAREAVKKGLITPHGYARIVSSKYPEKVNVPVIVDITFFYDPQDSAVIIDECYLLNILPDVENHIEGLRSLRNRSENQAIRKATMRLYNEIMYFDITEFLTDKCTENIIERFEDEVLESLEP